MLDSLAGQTRESLGETDCQACSSVNAVSSAVVSTGSPFSSMRRAIMYKNRLVEAANFKEDEIQAIGHQLPGPVFTQREAMDEVSHRSRIREIEVPRRCSCWGY